MTLEKIRDKKNELLACEALGWLHNIGKLDNRINNGQNIRPLTHNITGWKPKHSVLNVVGRPPIKKEIVRALLEHLAESGDVDDLVQVWKDASGNDLTKAWHVVKAMEKKGYEQRKARAFMSGFFLAFFASREQKVGLSNQDVAEFVGKYCRYRTESSCGSSPPAGLSLLGEKWPWEMLLNLFWDDYHFRPDPATGPEREDNLSFWLEDEEGYSTEMNRFLRIMAVCHEAISRGDKGEGRGNRPRGQENTWTNIFGTDEQAFRRIDDIPEQLKDKEIQEILSLFKGCASDGVLPVNDVSLHAYCRNFGAFLKTAAAGILLNNKIPEPHHLRWRLLWFRHDGPAWMGRGGRLADAVARRDTWFAMLDSLRQYLEVDLPLAAEIYRDTCGVFYLVPDIDDLLDRRVKKDGPALAEKIRELAGQATDFEFVPHLCLSDPMPGYDVKISPYMEDILPCNPDPAQIDKTWQNTHGEVCTVCMLRPIAAQGVAAKQRVCKICHKRRTGRSDAWREGGMAGTIWTTELADPQGRICLLAGRLAIGGWINGENFQSLDRKWNGAGEGLPDGPSFTRTREVWNISERFWRNVSERLIDPESRPLAPVAGRWQFKINDMAGAVKLNHAYELNLADTRLQVVCTEKNNSGATLTIIDRRAPAEKDRPPEMVLSGSSSWKLLQRGGYGRADTALGGVQPVQGSLRFNENSFAPFIEIWHDPHRFLCLLPADQATGAALWIKEQYWKKFNRVQDRLPLQLGLVYFPEKTPVFTVIDAGLRMLAADFPGKKSSLKQTPSSENIEDTATCRLELESGDGFMYKRHICGVEDRWYGRPWSMFAREYRPVGELAAPEKLCFQTQTLDMIHLSPTSKRHHIVYDNEKATRQDSDFGPMPIQPRDLETMARLWDLLSRLSRSQLGQLEAAHDYVREELVGAEPDAREFFLANSLKICGDGWWKKLEDDEQDLLLCPDHLRPDGLLWATLKHRLHLLKEKPVSEKKSTHHTPQEETAP